MTIEEIKKKNEILIRYLQSIDTNKNFKFKAEYSTNDNDKKVVVVQETAGRKIVFYNEETPPLFNYYNIEIFGTSIEECKSLMVQIGELIGKCVYYTDKKTNKIWEIIFMQFTNPQAIQYYDIRRIGYTTTMKCIINTIK